VADVRLAVDVVNRGCDVKTLCHSVVECGSKDSKAILRIVRGLDLPNKGQSPGWPYRSVFGKLGECSPF
jgi:hypothetical protein